MEICGGTKFYLSAPLTQVSDVAGSWSATMKGSITKIIQLIRFQQVPETRIWLWYLVKALMMRNM
mgnify:CR=1 FL=1